MSVRNKKQYNETEYAFISARVRSLEGSLISRSQLDRMLSAASTAEAFAILSEIGISGSGDKLSAASREELLLNMLKQGFDDLMCGLPDPEVLNIFKYPYDCNNIKAAIKCELRGINAESLLFEFGTVASSDVLKALKKRDFSCFPKNMAEAAPRAIETYIQTKNPQKIDFILDDACFSDIKELSDALSISYISKICAAKADLTNLMICIRVLRMNCGEYGFDLINDAIVSGGSIPQKAFLEAASNGEASLLHLAAKQYPTLAASFKSGDGLEKLERTCDNIRLALASVGKRITFGIEIPVSYIISLENEIQNIRIILAGKDAGLGEERIRERLRDCYV